MRLTLSALAMATRSEPEIEATAQLASELRIVLGRISRRLREHHRHFGMTQAAVLGRLDRCGPQSIGELATAERVRPQSMSQTLGDLETDRLIGRRTLVALTDEGRAALREERALREGALARSIEMLTPAERELLSEAVGVL